MPYIKKKCPACGSNQHVYHNVQKCRVCDARGLETVDKGRLLRYSLDVARDLLEKHDCLTPAESVRIWKRIRKVGK